MGPMRRALAVAILFGALAVATVAMAATPVTGKWSGKLTKYSSSPVKFQVVDGGKKLVKFSSPRTPVYCYNPYDYVGTTETRSAFVPSARVRNDGSFSKTYKVMRNGEETGEVVLKGRFTRARRAKGTLQITNAGCGGTVNWTARAQ